MELGRYHVVVGNPPYPQIEDEKLRSLYRELYYTCSGGYSLTVPFAQRFFELAKAGGKDGTGYGRVGQITGNAFMKREFGAKLIEQFFAQRIELVEVIDSSGAYIPGHGTPTVIIIGTNRSGKLRSSTVRTVRGIQGEPSIPESGEGMVWEAIVNQIDHPGSTSPWVSTEDLDRERYFSKHPWILADGGLEMVEQISKSSTTSLKSLTSSVGRTTSTGADDAFFLPDLATARRLGIENRVRPLVIGEAVRDFNFHHVIQVANPYADKQQRTLLPESDRLVSQFLWIDRRRLGKRKIFGRTLFEKCDAWYVHLENYSSKLETQLGLSFAFVETHNNFALDRDGLLFNRTAPVIKLAEAADEEHYIHLLGLLNSSTACFWLKMVCHDKGRPGADQAGADEPWEHRFEFTATKIESFPLPGVYPESLSRDLDNLSQELAAVTPSALIASGETPTVQSLHSAKARWKKIRAEMIALQEELDWEVYSIYKLTGKVLTAPKSSVPEISSAERAFSIVLARKIERGEVSTTWFDHHNHRFTAITEMPSHWPESYRRIVQKRIDAIETSRAIGMIERPEYKRRWATEGWDALQEKALRSWLLDRIEQREHWFDANDMPVLASLSRLISMLSQDDDFVSVANIYQPREELAKVVAGLMADEHVPFLSQLRYKPSGLRKRADWEHVWDLQRQEDAASDEIAKRRIRDSIPTPPRYTSADFLKPSYWRARGKLDVPKERFISYPTALGIQPQLFGWAGWDHREQAQALAAYFTSHALTREDITPFLAGLLELQPWLDQWHHEFHPQYSGSPAAFFDGYRQQIRGEHSLTDEDLRNWRPEATVRGRKSKK